METIDYNEYVCLNSSIPLEMNGDYLTCKADNEKIIISIKY